jgi:hypothetical protein
MASRNRLEQPKVPRGRGKLPDPFYYLNNFQTVLASIHRRYTELLSSEERQFIAHFSALPRVWCTTGPYGDAPGVLVSSQPIEVRRNR